MDMKHVKEGLHENAGRANTGSNERRDTKKGL